MTALQSAPDRSQQLTREYYAPRPLPHLARLEDIGFTMLVVLTTMLVAAIAFA